MKRRKQLFSASPVRTARQSIAEVMRPLLQEAQNTGSVLHLRCQNRTFTPRELFAEWKKGRYLYGPEWWTVRRPAA